jgi:hypothetical protein
LLLAVDQIIIHEKLNMYTPDVLQQFKSNVSPWIKLEDYGCINILLFAVEQAIIRETEDDL